MAEPEIGLFGLGLIGSAVAARLLAAGYALRGCDPDAARGLDLERAGGTACTAPEVWQADVVFSCVFDTDQLERLIDGAPQAGCTLVSLSTCDPDRMQGLADKAAQKGITLIEMPVSGTSRALANGSALLLIAGCKDTAARIDPILSAICANRLHVGGIGNGNRAKLAINLVLGLNRAALAEGMVFANALGLSSQEFLDMARVSAARSDVMDAKGPLMVARDFTPQGRIAQSLKDFTLIAERGAARGQGLPFANRYLEMMRDAVAQGEGDLDNAAVLLPIERARP
ncbi:NAD(P)-dependent oxidoreductase [Citreicella sp. C3M06]|uniref:NAD(P)-dependent oxidoreductase n=1 Tax=Citreicella sp. C3M06 TaxID=2841564 RepID=UPI001C082F0F|nr:NAD(P)-dependent oxidoreductase [Citreicella sp. C3M06]MBU2959263.1 NAD(P)-dependent oxidoreductase [Citreicella sp. C3M06]